MLKTKKGQVPLLKTIFILLVSTIILIIYSSNLSNAKYLSDDRKTRTQIVETKILNECFSNELGTIKISDFKEETLNYCFKVDISNIFAKIIVDNKELYLGKKEDFENKQQFCSSPKSNLMCTKLKYPVIVEDQNKQPKQSILTLYIIVQ